MTWEARPLSTPGTLGTPGTPGTLGTPSTPGTLRIVLHSDVSGRSLTPVVEHSGPGSGVRYVTEDPRSFFFVIESKDLAWSVAVAEGIAATRGPNHSK